MPCHLFFLFALQKVVAMDRTCRGFPSEIAEIVDSFLLTIHPAAKLIKGLTFEYLEEENRCGAGVYLPTRLSVSNGAFLMTPNLWGSSRGQALSDSRAFSLQDFGEPSYDRYTMESALDSGFTLGRVRT